MSEFVAYLTEVFEPFGSIHSRRMFGGHGIYHDGLMFGLVADDQLYLKVDAESEAHFRRFELPAFEYNKRGKIMKMSYRLAPESIFDDPEVALTWARLAFDAALRARNTRQ